MRTIKKSFIYLKTILKAVAKRIKRIKRRPSKEGPSRDELDWIFAQIYYTRKIKKDKEYPNIDDICLGIATEFPIIIGRKIKGLPNGPPMGTIRDWYNYQIFPLYRPFKKELETVFKKCIFHNR